VKVSSRPGKLRRAGLVAAATATAALLSSCGMGSPGVAAEVEGDRIPTEKVDDFAQVLCALGGLPGTESGTPTGEARYRALEILLADELAADVADLDATDRARVAETTTRLSAARDTVPAELRETYDEVISEYVTAEFAIIELGRQSLVEQGQQRGQISDDAAYAEGARLRQQYAASADIEVNPRYGEVVDGVLRPTDGSLSVPVSELAVQASEEEPSESLVGTLPATQKCG
jgi:sulfur carrier protein ThiS